MAKRLGSTLSEMLDRFKTTLFIMAAISIHSIFSGLALGVASDPSIFWSVFIAIVAHKVFDGFVVGTHAVKSKGNWKEVAIIGTPVLLAEPLGIIIGMNIHSDSPWVEGILLSLVTGAFIYIGATEVGDGPAGGLDSLDLHRLGLGRGSRVAMARSAGSVHRHGAGRQSCISNADHCGRAGDDTP